MEILHLNAIGYVRPMNSGRTSPFLIRANDRNGQSVEVVAKLRGQEMDAKSQIAELVAAPLASHLGLNVPQAAVVEITTEFVEAVPEPTAGTFKKSDGKNFGSVHLGAGFMPWCSGRTLSSDCRDQAGDIFAFDLLVQNQDRRRENPNLWSRSGSVGVYDHEQAFSFLHLPILLGGASLPWAVNGPLHAFNFMTNHAFHRDLRGNILSFEAFEARLAALSDEVIRGLLTAVPMEWRIGNDLCDRIADYLNEAREQRASFIGFARHLLR